MTAKFAGTFPFQLRSTIAPAAPDLATSSTNLWPSKFSPRIATNSSPSLIVRESVLILSTDFLPSPCSSFAPANSAICKIDNGFIYILRDDFRSRGARPECLQKEQCDRQTPD